MMSSDIYNNESKAAKTTVCKQQERSPLNTEEPTNEYRDECKYKYFYQQSFKTQSSSLFTLLKIKMSRLHSTEIEIFSKMSTSK